ncbi:MAG: RHS repeat protein, partial [Theionarchaea archaeon]|nr:RHS repeat protein [Theionarchaea archaeon]
KFEWTLYIDQESSPQEYVTSFYHDEYGNLTSIINSLGDMTTFAYSADYGHAYVTSVTSPLGATASAVHDFPSGNTLSITDPRGYTTSYQYDLLGRVTKKINPDSSEREAIYSDNNNSVTIYDELDHFVKSYYDGLGRTTLFQYYLNNEIYAVETYTYNYLNMTATYTDPLGYTYYYEYDSKGRPVLSTNPDGTTRETQYDDVTNTVTLSDENQHTKRLKLDWNNRILWVQEFMDSSNYFHTQYEYNQAGNLIRLIDANQNITTHEYGYSGLTTITYPDGTTEVFTYDLLGNLISKTDGEGNTITFTYDAASRLSQMQSPDSVFSFEYDANGNRILMTDSTGTSTYTYDNRNRLLSETRTIFGAAYTVQSEYDAASRLISVTYPNDTVVDLAYDDLNRLISVYGFAEYSYNAKSQIQHVAYANGVETDFMYGCLCGQPTQIHAAKNGNELLALIYTYDAVGNITQKEKSILNPQTQTLETFSGFYSYDWLNRLVSTSVDGGLLSYDYDAVGNRISVNGMQFTHNAVNELVSMSDGTIITYDNDGKMLSKIGTDSWAYQYDYINQLTQVQKNGQTIGQYGYDGDGRRIQKTEWSEVQQTLETVIYVYNGLNTLYEKNTSTEMDALYIYGPTGRIAKKVGDATFYYHADHLSSTQLITDENGCVVTMVDYEPFGSVETRGEPEKYLFTGKEVDSSQLYYYGARYYDPELGRFLTRDPERGQLVNPQSLNRYVYCLNNPLRYKDVWGLSASENSQDCTCASDPGVQGLLQDLDTVENQITWIEDLLIREDKLRMRWQSSVDACVQHALQLAKGEPYWDMSKYVVPAGFVGWVVLTWLKEYPTFLALIEKFIAFAMEAIAFIWMSDSILTAFRCYFAVQQLQSAVKTIDAYTKMLQQKVTQRDKIVDRIRGTCECALPDEYDQNSDSS